MKAVLLYGPPGTGKLTIAKTLVKKLGFVLLDNHLTFNVVHKIYKYDNTQFRPLLQDLRYAIFESVSKSDIKGVILTWVYDANNLLDDEFVKRVQTYFSDIVFVRLSCDDDELKKRFTSESRKMAGKLNSLDALEKTYAGRNVTVPIPFVENIEINNTHMSPHEVSDLIIQKL